MLARRLVRQGAQFTGVDFFIATKIALIVFGHVVRYLVAVTVVAASYIISVRNFLKVPPRRCTLAVGSLRTLSRNSMW